MPLYKPDPVVLNWGYVLNCEKVHDYAFEYGIL